MAQPTDRTQTMVPACQTSPKLQRPAQGLSLDASQTWLKEHAAQYKGQWIAVQEGTLLGAAPTLQDL
jgi:hypothetical protein